MIRCIVALFAVAALAGPALAGDDGEVNMKLATVAPKGATAQPRRWASRPT